MQVTLSPKWTAFVKKQIKAKKYRSAEELLQKALSTMQENDAELDRENPPEDAQGYLEWQRREVAKGLADKESFVMTDELIADVKARGRRRLAALRRT